MMASIPSEAWLWNLADAGARSLLMAAAVGLGLRLLRVGNVMARKAAWTLVLCAAMLMPVITPWAENQSWLPIRAAEVPVQSWLARLASWRSGSGIEPPVPVHHYPMRVEGSAIESTRLGVTGQRTASPTLSIDHYPSPAIALDGQSRIEGNVSAPIPAARKLSRGETAFLIYAVVSLILLIRIGVGGVAAARLWMRATPLPEIEARFEIEGRIRWSCDLPSPITVGSGIVLPSGYASWDVEKLRIVLAHEGSHVRQGDFYLQLGAALYGAMFWFSPLGWWLKRTLCDLSEAISDRAAVSEAATHASYAQILLEFAALPRTTRIGVAMARAGRLSHRIDRLLDESSFRRAFAGGRGRIAVAALLAPLALLAAMSLRVHAAGQAPPAAQAPATPAIPAAPATPPVAPAAPEVPPAPAAPDAIGEPPVAPEPPSEPDAVGPSPGVRMIGGVGIGDGDSYSTSSSQSERTSNGSRGRDSTNSTNGQHYSYSYSDNGESYALVRGKDNVSFSGDWFEERHEELDKARQVAHGDFLWFTHNGKSYVVDDATIVGQISDMYKPMEDLGRQQEELGRQQEELGRQQEKLGKLMNQASVPAPDISREMAELNAAVAELNAAKDKNVTQEQLAELQAKLADVQGKLGSLQGEVGARQGEIGAQQGELGARQGKLGEQQGRLGAEQGRIAREADRKVKSIIDQSLKNGKARPVE